MKKYVRWSEKFFSSFKFCLMFITKNPPPGFLTKTNYSTLWQMGWKKAQIEQATL